MAEEIKFYTTSYYYNMAHMTISVDSMIEDRPQGVIENPYLSDALPFYGIDALIFEIDRACDLISFPKATFNRRALFEGAKDIDSITTVTEQQVPTSFKHRYRKGKKITFSVIVLYRQHGSLQGEITIPQGTKLIQRCFRSALELMYFIKELCAESINE